MATVALTPDVMTEAGIAETVNGSLSTSNTYTIRNNGKTFLHVKNTGGSPINVVVAAAATARGHAITGTTVAIPATTGDKLIGPFAPDIYDDQNHDVSFTISGATGVTVAVVQIP